MYGLAAARYNTRMDEKEETLPHFAFWPVLCISVVWGLLKFANEIGNGVPLFMSTIGAICAFGFVLITCWVSMKMARRQLNRRRKA